MKRINGLQDSVVINYSQSWVVEPLSLLVVKKWISKTDYITILDLTKNKSVTNDELYKVVVELCGKKPTAVFVTFFDKENSQNKMVEIDFDALKEQGDFTFKVNIQNKPQNYDQEQEKNEKDILHNHSWRNTSVMDENTPKNECPEEGADCINCKNTKCEHRIELSC